MGTRKPEPPPNGITKPAPPAAPPAISLPQPPHARAMRRPETPDEIDLAGEHIAQLILLRRYREAADATGSLTPLGAAYVAIGMPGRLRGLCGSAQAAEPTARFSAAVRQLHIEALAEPAAPPETTLGPTASLADLDELAAIVGNYFRIVARTESSERAADASERIEKLRARWDGSRS